MKIKAAIGYIDLQAAMNGLFILMVGLLMLQVHTIQESTGNLQQKADTIITMDWPDNSQDDVDLWVKGPNGEILFYKNRAAGVLTLDQDERGLNSLVSYRQEVASLRGREPGIYIVKIVMFSKRETDPATVNVHLIQVNPRYEKMAEVSLTLDKYGNTKVAFKFQVAEDGTVTVLNSSEEDNF